MRKRKSKFFSFFNTNFSILLGLLPIFQNFTFRAQLSFQCLLEGLAFRLLVTRCRTITRCSLHVTLCLLLVVNSSIVNEVIRIISRQFCFFTKKFWVYKKLQSKRKTNDFHHLRRFSARKIVAFVVFCLLSFVLLVGFGLWCVFYAQNFLVKKIKLPWNCPDNLIYYTTDVYPYQPIYLEFISIHLCLQDT